MGLMDWVREKYHARETQKNIKAVRDGIMYGGYIVKNPVCEPAVKTVLKKIRKDIYEYLSDFERVELVTKNFSEEDLMDFVGTLDSYMIKHDITVSCFKDKAYECFEMFHYEMAIRCCNLALMFAPSASTLLPGLHADRATFLHTINDWEPVSKDVDVALDLSQDFTDELKAELVRMKRKCLRFHNNLLQETPDSETEKRRHYSEDVLFNIFGGESPTIRSAGNFIKITEHPVKGRILVATQDLAAGITVIVEDPFVSVMTESVNWELKHCAKCYKRTRFFVPCPDCIHTTYCSDECRLGDYDSIHKYECPCLNFFHSIYIPWNMQLGFRAITRTGPESIFKFYMDKLYLESESPWQDQLKRFFPDTLSYDSSFLEIYNLISHPSPQYLDLQTWYSVALAKILHKKTTFFDAVDERYKPEFEDFIASCILRHVQSFPFNSMILWEAEKPLKPGRTMKSTSEKYGDVGMNGVFALSSLISHSCDPSALRVNLMSGRLAIVTHRRLKAGEEITIPYGYEFSTDELKCRSDVLEKDFKFKCQCVACVCLWPTENKIGSQVEYLCSDCSNESTYEQNILYQKSVLIVQKSTGLGTCLKCKKDFDMTALKEDVKKYEDILEKARRLMVADNPVDAVPSFIECIEFFQTHVLPPFVPLIKAQSYLSCAFDLIATNTRL